MKLTYTIISYAEEIILSGMTSSGLPRAQWYAVITTG
jgi:hypothetical protein